MNEFTLLLDIKVLTDTVLQIQSTEPVAKARLAALNALPALERQVMVLRDTLSQQEWAQDRMPSQYPLFALTTDTDAGMGVSLHRIRAQAEASKFVEGYNQLLEELNLSHKEHAETGDLTHLQNTLDNHVFDAGETVYDIKMVFPADGDQSAILQQAHIEAAYIKSKAELTAWLEKKASDLGVPTSFKFEPMVVWAADCNNRTVLEVLAIYQRTHLALAEQGLIDVTPTTASTASMEPGV